MILKRTAPAKINLGLHVLRKRPDGYHDLETVFLRVPWADVVGVEPGERIVMTCSDPTLTTDETNLVMKAARQMADKFGVIQGAALHLEKNIPYGAGLGGGSSDAAATLRLLADFWGLQASAAHLHAEAAALGSDVPFFLHSDLAAYATGRGERLIRLLDPTSGSVYHFPFFLVIIVPPVQVSTEEAYRLVRPSSQERPDLRAVVASNDLERWRAELKNDFEGPIFAAYPTLPAARALLVENGAGYTALSGSGSAVFGVFEAEGAAAASAERARREGYRAWHGSV